MGRLGMEGREAREEQKLGSRQETVRLVVASMDGGGVGNQQT